MLDFLPEIPLVQAVDPVRAHAFLGLGMFQGLGGGLGKGGGMVDQDCWWRVGVMIIFTGKPMFWAVAPIRAC